MSEFAAVTAGLVGQDVVLDTSGQYLYIGRLARMDEFFIELEDADVHDSTESPNPKEIYVIDSKKYGIKKNRKSVFVRASMVVSISRLVDVIEY